MATNPAIPFWDKADTITCHAGAAITGKRFVTVSGARVEGNPRVVHAAGAVGNRALGVSAYDAASGNKVTVYTGGQVMPVTAAAAITAGQLVYSDATGQATATATGTAIGIAVDDAAAGADCPVKLL